LNCKGMTLIEVLIASVLLFIAIAAGALVTRTMYLHQERTENSIERHYVIDTIKDEIDFSLRFNNTFSGELSLNSASLAWQASAIEKKPYADSVNTAAGGINSDRGFLTLYDVTVTHSNNSVVWFNYQTIIWSKT